MGRLESLEDLLGDQLADMQCLSYSLALITGCDAVKHKDNPYIPMFSGVNYGESHAPRRRRYAPLEPQQFPDRQTLSSIDLYTAAVTQAVIASTALAS